MRGLTIGVEAFILLVGTQWVEGGTVITFDDVPAIRLGNNLSDVIREEYAGLGVHFNRDGRFSGIVRMGLSQGDPGNWDLEGSNGPQFLGHNVYGRTGLIEFDWPVMSFKIDAAHAHDVGVQNLTFRAYDATGLLESVTLPSSVPGVWQTISLSAAGITRIEYSSGQSFALDNMVFAPVPEPSTLALLSVGSLGLLAYVWRRRKHLAYLLGTSLCIS
jgi:hypothetical protein